MNFVKVNECFQALDNIYSMNCHCSTLFLSLQILTYYYLHFVTRFMFQIPATVTRILLNHFKWDKEKLMEWYVSIIIIILYYCIVTILTVNI